MKTQMTLLELSNELVALGYPDLFDYDVQREILNIDKMVGTVADIEGDNIVIFNVIDLGEIEDGNILFPLEVIIEINLELVKDLNY